MAERIVADLILLEQAARLAWLRQVIALVHGDHGRALGTNVRMWTV